VIKFLKTEDKFQEIRLEEIYKLTYMADSDGVIGGSVIRLNKDDYIEVLSGPLKGFEGWITKLNRRKSRVAVNVLLGSNRHEVCLMRNMWIKLNLVRWAKKLSSR
jgi:transcription antitermination factor NusG